MKKIKENLPEIIGIGAILLTIAVLGLILYWLVSDNYPKALLELAWSIPEKTGWIIVAAVTALAMAAWAYIIYEIARAKRANED